MKKAQASSPKETPRRAPGAFMPDGSYRADAELPDRGTTDRFVRAMVASRGGPLFTPELAAEGIVLAKQTAAFPNHAQWASVREHVHPEAAVWPFVLTTTSAEEAVKRCGRGVGDPTTDPRHWCGECWVIGSEKECPSAGHRIEHDASRIQSLADGLFRKLDPAPITFDPEHVAREQQRARGYLTELES